VLRFSQGQLPLLRRRHRPSRWSRRRSGTSSLMAAALSSMASRVILAHGAHAAVRVLERGRRTSWNHVRVRAQVSRLACSGRRDERTARSRPRMQDGRSTTTSATRNRGRFCARTSRSSAACGALFVPRDVSSA